MLLRYLSSRKILVLIGAVYLISLILNAIGVPVWLPFCPIKALTGYECLGCGTNRALIDLLSFRISEAWQHNKLIFFFLPIIAYLLGRDFHRFYSNNSTYNNT
jgi:hypothetical protein